MRSLPHAESMPIRAAAPAAVFLALTILLGAPALLLALDPGSSLARVWTVAQEGPADFPTIQQAIDAAHDGDEIRIFPGTYFESLFLQSKVITLTGVAGAAATIVDATGLGSGLRIPFTPNGQPVVRGLTFQNGIGTPLQAPLHVPLPRDGRYGGGILIDSAHPRIEDCVVSGNGGTDGGGVAIIGGWPTLRRCRIAGNAAGNGGGVSLLIDVGSTFEDCEIVDNASVTGGGFAGFRSGPRLLDCVVAGNSAVDGGAIHLTLPGETVCRVEGSRLVDNFAERGGAIFATGVSLRVDGATIAGNRADPGESPAISLEDGAALQMTATVVQAAGGGEVFSCAGVPPAYLDCAVLWPAEAVDPSCFTGDRVLVADPRFCDPGAGDYAPSSDSPLLPGHGPAGCGRIGALDAGCEEPTAVATVDWGRLRLLFR
ncbi:MAG: right-handed parallel beta-helix repeat-containing protein [Candidatus Eisenbacteria bacterium]